MRLLTTEWLAALVRYYEAAGAIRGPETARILLDHLTHAARFLAEGQQSAYESQLRAFVLQVQGLPHSG